RQGKGTSVPRKGAGPIGVFLSSSWWLKLNTQRRFRHPATRTVQCQNQTPSCGSNRGTDQQALAGKTPRHRSIIGGRRRVKNGPPRFRSNLARLHAWIYAASRTAAKAHPRKIADSNHREAVSVADTDKSGIDISDQ